MKSIAICGMALMLAGTAFAYNAGLIVTYIVHFEGEMGIGAHSYFRYNTHLALLIEFALVVTIRKRVAPWLAGRPQLRRLQPRSRRCSQPR